MKNITPEYSETFFISLDNLDVAGRIDSYRVFTSEDGEHRKYINKTVITSAIGEGGEEVDVDSLMANAEFMLTIENELENSCG